MPLEIQKCEAIISLMKSMTVDDRLKAINESKSYLENSFKPEMTNADYAYSAYVLETTYNLIREELRVKQMRIKADAGSEVTTVNNTPKSAKAISKTKKEKPKPLDMKAAMAEFAKFMKETATSAPTNPPSNTPSSNTES